ncbi:MAG: methylmalonyl-CoA mutase family protein [Myxococcota bacterium]|nr:methylmalonyl-CoA mutase family protein [Myxococcota bacterium]
MSLAAESLDRLSGAAPPVRVVTAASLFDGHDVAINIMRRLLQARGAEVIHLGHDRSVEEIVDAAVQEGADAVAISSYQGGHLEFFAYLVRRLAERGAGDVRVYGGGGGTITREEIAKLHEAGVARIFSPQDGRSMGLEGMIDLILQECRGRPRPGVPRSPSQFLEEARCVEASDPAGVSRLISGLEQQSEGLESVRAELERRGALRSEERALPVVGITGPGGSGKSSVVDELLRRFSAHLPDLSLGLLLVDPTRRNSGGALLGDRIRLNSIRDGRVFVRSQATRQAHRAVSAGVNDAILVLKAAGFDLIFVETAGIGQSDSEIIDLVDHSLYVMTPEFGAPSQLEKIDMLELADCVVLNKFDRHGAKDALRDIRKQWKRNHEAAVRADGEIPVFPTIARQWDDPGADRLFEALRTRLEASAGEHFSADARWGQGQVREPVDTPLIPGARRRYLAEIAEVVRSYRQETEVLCERARVADALGRVRAEFGEDTTSVGELAARHETALSALPPELRERLAAWPEMRERYEGASQSYAVRGREFPVENHTETLSGTQIPKVALPRTDDWGDLARFFRNENVPGAFPFTAGVFPFRRTGEDPTRMFAGEGGPERTNRRFHYLSRGHEAARLSTAFDSVTLYGRDPETRPDIYGKCGNSGVSICTLDDAKKLYSGFDLCAPATSVSLTINGPAPTLLAFFLNAAIDQQVERHLRENGRLEAVRARFDDLPSYQGELPEGHDGLGLGLLGIPGDQAVDADTYARIKADALHRVRGTVQADILKEDQAQNTCIFSTEFSLKVMGDIQEYFTANEVQNFYSVSISGYHMAEAGANPITQLAFTLANGFTYCESYLARGMSIDEFAPNFSFFFSTGLDAEYNVIGRVARRIWSVAMRERYGASERSQKLKYHIQTSGRSLHAQEMSFNDIRTTLQAMTALQDGCNSLHTNAYDEAVTTPTEESVRRAVAIQLILAREFGVFKNENFAQGSYLTETLTDLVEEAVLEEFERLSERGGVLGAMETLYQRSKIQEESLHYESLKHSGELPVIGVNTFENPQAESVEPAPDSLIRSSDEEKDARLRELSAVHARWRDSAPAALESLSAAAIRGENIFGQLMETVKTVSLGQISEALFEVGGRYRRSM